MKTTMLPLAEKFCGFFFVLLLSAFPTSTSAQKGYFEQGYGDGDTLVECAYDLYLENDYRAVLTGYSEIPGHQKDLTVLMHDSLGTQHWVTHSGGTGNEAGYAIVKSGAGYLVAGYTESSGAGGKDIYLVRLDASGGITWTKTIGSRDDETARSITESPTGFIVAGWRESTNGSDFLIVSIDTSGNQLWQVSFGGTGDQRAYDARIRDGRILVVGTDWERNKPLTAGLLLELDMGGLVRNYYPVAPLDNITLEALTFDRSGGYLLAGAITHIGQPEPNGLFLKLDSTGQLVSQREYGTTDSAEVFHDIRRIGGLVILLGETRGWGEGGSDMLLVYADSMGDTLSTHTMGGIGDETGYGMFQYNGRLYCTGYNDTYGTSSSGNMYETRQDLEPLAANISSGESSPLFNMVPLDCKMHRVLYVEKAFHNANPNVYGFRLATWSADAWVDTMEFEDTSIYHLGIIGNSYRENQLLDFICKHSITEIYFYDVDKIFAKGNSYNTWVPYENNYNGVNYITNPPNPYATTVTDYMKYRLNRFVIRAQRCGLKTAGFVVGPYDSLDKRFQALDNVIEYNNLVRNQSYNYKHAGKVGGMAMEHEFWNWGLTTSDTPFDTAWFHHKIYLRELLNYKALDDNQQLVNDYIGYYNNNRDINHDNNSDEPNEPTSCSDTVLVERAAQLVNLQDDFGKGKYIDRFFNIYYLSGCTNVIIERDTSTGARYQRPSWAYRTAITGGRNGGKETQVFPVFGIFSSSIPAIGGETNDLGYWMATRDNKKPTEPRKMKNVEDLFMNDYTGNRYYGTCHDKPGKALNGFVYFTYQQLQKLAAYNTSMGYSFNFTNNDSTPRIARSEYPALVTLPCSTYVPVFVPKGKKAVSSNQLTDAERTSYVYPNPASDMLIVALTQNEPFSAYQVFDTMGRLVRSGNCSGNNTNDCTIDVQTLAPGMYYLLLNQKTGSTQHKFLVQ